jgi:predicted SprT family Zn-dependent metalloprotease
MVNQNPVHLEAATADRLQQPVADELAHCRFWVINLPDRSQGGEIKSRGLWREGPQTDEALAGLFV